jgi:hypothetical protein
MSHGVGGQLTDEQDRVVVGGAAVEKGGQHAPYERDLIAAAGE